MAPQGRYTNPPSYWEHSKLKCEIILLYIMELTMRETYAHGHKLKKRNNFITQMWKDDQLPVWNRARATVGEQEGVREGGKVFGTLIKTFWKRYISLQFSAVQIRSALSFNHWSSSQCPMSSKWIIIYNYSLQYAKEIFILRINITHANVGQIWTYKNILVLISILCRKFDTFLFHCS